MADERLQELQGERDRLLSDLTEAEITVVKLKTAFDLVEARIDEHEKMLAQMPVGRRDVGALIAVERANGLAPAAIARKLGIKLSRVTRAVAPPDGEGA
jgi:hypothetical protein